MKTYTNSATVVNMTVHRSCKKECEPVITLVMLWYSPDSFSQLTRMEQLPLPIYSISTGPGYEESTIL